VAVTNSDVVIVALKPNICEKALTPLKELIDANKIIVSIAAGKKIVEGAVSMVEMALTNLSENNVVTLDEERKAAMVSNLLVVL
ncbi:NAD(P)-binding domain-containing protein, partial [Clostridioides difficile]|uniref:NAD(P)-binding domain-containing protein n=1 Tax=Clostridioides difficile TaxID=1496 RepID=UPI00155A618F